MRGCAREAQQDVPRQQSSERRLSAYLVRADFRLRVRQRRPLAQRDIALALHIVSARGDFPPIALIVMNIY
jgi:hypothetical protein